ncbi:hypothetical protein CLG96_01835 [Sphingomonas oleivorans]|uniref:Secreted protein n=1 Tax=Sphingomonas oleivorans TaxID=1735121 RepID=A0A2T5G185_9SPHN|nr:hypothetical protein [Sphingomonas oleivorans]PTQ12908.1 hypothetical protein CLG96_01835 [Sphingomonas oleivorans]
MMTARFALLALPLLVISTVSVAGAPETATGGAAPQQAKEKIICKTSYETGSFVKRRRNCATKRQWDDAATAARSTTQGMQNQLFTPDQN